MKLLLIVGSTNDIFINNYAKWLKASMDVNIDVFGVYSDSLQDYNNSYYDSVTSARGFLLRTPKAKSLIDNIVRGIELSRYLKNKHFDIIHCHWITSPMVLQKKLHKHCNKLVFTFWGGESKNQTIMYSSQLYRFFLRRRIKEVDCIINSKEAENSYRAQFPNYKGDYKYGILGSTPIEELYNLMQLEDKSSSKIALDISEEKIVVLIGYSGKRLHRHIPIIREFQKYSQLKEKVHLLVPMTRGAESSYIKDVHKELKELRFSYTLIFGHFLTDTEIARIRNATDITLQLSEFDGFSRSIIECLCAKSVVIYGDWLGYEKYMKQLSFEGIEVSSLEAGVEKIESVISNMADYDEMLNNNKESGMHRYFWSECIKDWVKAYKDLLID